MISKAMPPYSLTCLEGHPLNPPISNHHMLRGFFLDTQARFALYSPHHKTEFWDSLSFRIGSRNRDAINQGDER